MRFAFYEVPSRRFDRNHVVFSQCDGCLQAVFGHGIEEPAAKKGEFLEPYVVLPRKGDIRADNYHGSGAVRRNAIERKLPDSVGFMKPQ